MVADSSVVQVTVAAPAETAALTAVMDGPVVSGAVSVTNDSGALAVTGSVVELPAASTDVTR